MPASLIIIILVLAACGGSGSQAPASTSQSASAAPTSTTSQSDVARIDEGVELVWVDGGGAYHDAVVAACLDDYAASTGVEFSFVGQTDNALVRAQVEEDNVTYSVYNGDNTWGLAEHAEWLEPIDYSVVSSDGIIEGFASEYRVGNMIYSMTISYNSDEVGSNIPQTWADFFDTSSFPGKRCVPSWATGGLYEAALLADGIPPAQLYPLDLDRAEAKMDTIRDELIFWNSGAESEDLLGTGEASMCMMYNARAWDAKHNLGFPVEVQWNEQILAAAYLTVPKGAENVDAAMRLISYIVDPANNGKLSDHFTVAPVHEDAQVNPDLAPELPTSYLDMTYAVFDDEWVVANSDLLNERYTAWQTR